MLQQLFLDLSAWVNSHPGWAGVAVFSMAFAESLAIVGTLVPGVAILFGIGTLIGSGALDFWHMCLWALLGAILGDGISFWFGRRYKASLTSIWPFKKHPSSLEKGTAFFRKHGTLSVAFGRFFGPVRAVIPLIAGMMEMPPMRFVAANVGSALVWAPAYLLPGTLFGASLDMASEIAFRLAMLILLLLASLWFLGWLAHRLVLFAQPHAQAILARMLSAADNIPLFRRIAHALADPHHPESAGLALLAGLLALSILALALLGLLPGRPFAGLDETQQLVRQALSSDAGDHLMLAISAIASNTTGLALLPAIWAILKYSGHSLAARHWLAGFGLIWLVALLLEIFLATDSAWLHILPDVYLLRAAGLYLLSAILCSQAMQVSTRWLAYSTAAMLVSAVTIAQLYHGSSLSSVLQGLLIGIIWISAVGIAYRTHAQAEPLKPRTALIMALILAMLALASLVGTRAPTARPDFRPLLPMQQDVWWSQGWQQLPGHRDDLKQQTGERLDIQYAGNLDDLAKALMADGWQTSSSAPSAQWLSMLSADAGIVGLPTLPHSHDGRFETRLLVRNRDDVREVIYLWPSSYLLQPSGQRIWLGATGIQHSRKLLGILSYPVTRQSPTAAHLLASSPELASFSAKLVGEGTILLQQ